MMTRIDGGNEQHSGWIVQGDCGAMYHVLRTEQGWEVRAIDRTGLSPEMNWHSSSKDVGKLGARKLMLYR